jgi:hypothetical protein
LQLLRLLRHGGQLLRTNRLRRSSLLPPSALVRMAHDGPYLRTSGAGNTDACLCPRHAPDSGKLGTADRATSTTASSTSSTTTTTANTTAKFLRLNDDVDHNNITFIDFIYGDYITNNIIDHDYSSRLHRHRQQELPPHLRLMLQSDRLLHCRSDCGGGVRV